MTAKTDFTEERTLDFWLNSNGLTTVTPPNVEVSLHTVSPGETGSTANEVSGFAYARVQGVGWTVTATCSGRTTRVSFGHGDEGTA